jgi:F0F1-type ATP synthase membrane subunit c/vacuolar-type H+-ATPase subunit K
MLRTVPAYPTPATALGLSTLMNAALCAAALVVVFITAVKCMAFTIATIPLGGCALGVGLIFAALLRAEAYSPDLDDVLSNHAMLGFALVESFMLIVVAMSFYMGYVL